MGRIGHGPRQLAAYTAEAAPLIPENVLIPVAVQIDAGHVAVAKISINILPDSNEHSAKKGQFLGQGRSFQTRFGRWSHIVLRKKAQGEKGVPEGPRHHTAVSR